MAKKTLGLIGRGSVVDHFFSHITTEQYLVLSDCVERVVFYNGTYDTNEAFKAHVHKNPISGEEVSFSSLEAKIKNNFTNEISVDVESSFSRFFADSEVIVDSSAAYRPKSLFESAVILADVGRSKEWNNYRNNLNQKNDFKQYKIDCNGADGEIEVGKKVLSEKEFNQQWNCSLAVMEIVKEVRDLFMRGENEKHFGLRIFDELPFHVPMMINRAGVLQDILTRGKRPLPTYINLVNEPCVTSSIVATICPEMASYIVACTGVDVVRLERVLNEDEVYKSIKESEGIKRDLYVSIKGIHDKGLMIPDICQYNSNDKNNGQLRLFLHNVTPQLYTFLKSEVENYWSKHNETRDVMEELDRSLFHLVVNAFRSRGKALSVFPNGNERALCNGYFQEKYDDGSSSFSVGEQRFRNGKVVGEML